MSVPRSKVLKARCKVNRHLPLSVYFRDSEEHYFILSDEQTHLPVKMTTHTIDPGPQYGDISGKPSFVPEKYWSQRYSLFSCFDEGILMDEESWYSVTHEEVAYIIASACATQSYIVDGFAGVGGNAIQFAANSHVIAIEIDNKKANYLRSNAKVYGVQQKVKVIVGDFFEIAPKLGPVDVVFLSPPWGGPDYQEESVFSMLSMLSQDLKSILEVCRLITKSVFLYMPRNIDPMELLEICRLVPDFPRKVEIQLYFFGNKLKTVGIFLGDAVALDPFLVAECAVSQEISCPALARLNGEFANNPIAVQAALANLIEAVGPDVVLSV